MAKKPAKKAAVKKKTVKKKSPAKKSGLAQMTYSLSPELQEIVGSKKLSRPQIVKHLWAYIKAHKCQDAKNKRMIVPDKKLSEIFGKKPIDMLKLATHLHVLAKMAPLPDPKLPLLDSAPTSPVACQHRL